MDRWPGREAEEARETSFPDKVLERAGDPLTIGNTAEEPRCPITRWSPGLPDRAKAAR